MARSASAPAAQSTARLAAFVVERFPFAITAVQRALEGFGVGRALSGPPDRASFRQALERELRSVDVAGLPETTAGVAAGKRWEIAVGELLDACDGFIAREKIAESITAEEKLEVMRGMVLMRALDNRLKQFYLQG